MSVDRRTQRQKEIIVSLTKENDELRKELNAANERFETMQREQFQRVESMDALLDNLRSLKRSYELSIASINDARERFEGERIKYLELRKEYKKQVDEVIKNIKKGG